MKPFRMLHESTMEELAGKTPEKEEELLEKRGIFERTLEKKVETPRKKGELIMQEKNVRILEIGKESTAIMKAVAFFMVIVAHYYRFYSNGSRLSALGSMGFFGAAVFAFLSGYGVMKSYNANGFGVGWIGKKLRKIYIPFLIVNILSVIFVYGIREDGSNIIGRIVFGTDDYVMWYIPFVLGFDLCFFFIYNLKISNRNRLILFGLICVIQIVALRLVNAGSQWYTATGSLFLGVLLAGHPVSIKKKSRHILNFIVSWCIFTVSGIVSKLYVDYSTIKDCFTCISGMAFCFGMLVLFEEIEKLGLLKLLHFLQCIGNASLWGYILHMKVLYLLCRYVGRINVVIYIASVCFAMMIFDATWKRIIFVNRKLQ